ncbi:MAG: hypothetical protein WDM90_05045 [Ferruginibacter sp.]
MFKGKGEAFTRHIKNEEVKDWLAFQRSTNVFIDTYLENATSLNYYWHSLGAVALGISTYAPLSDEELQLFQRFLKVFDLSYRRYLDIEIAIAQSTEAKIEAALEKVRSRSLAMQKSEELKDVVATVFEKMNELFFLTDGGVSIVTGFKAFEYADHWVAADKIGESVLVRFPYTQNPIPSDFTQAKINGTSFYSKKYTKEVIENNWRLNFEHGLYKDYPDEFKNWFLSREVMHFTVAFEKILQLRLQAI